MMTYRRHFNLLTFLVAAMGCAIACPLPAKCPLERYELRGQVDLPNLGLATPADVAIFFDNYSEPASDRSIAQVNALNHVGQSGNFVVVGYFDSFRKSSWLWGDV